MGIRDGAFPKVPVSCVEGCVRAKVTSRDALVAAEVPGRIVCAAGSLKITPVGITDGSKSLGSLVCFSPFQLEDLNIRNGFTSSALPDAVPKATIHRNSVHDTAHFELIRMVLTTFGWSPSEEP